MRRIVVETKEKPSRLHHEGSCCKMIGLQCNVDAKASLIESRSIRLQSPLTVGIRLRCSSAKQHGLRSATAFSRTSCGEPPLPALGIPEHGRWRRRQSVSACAQLGFPRLELLPCDASMLQHAWLSSSACNCAIMARLRPRTHEIR